MVSRQVEEVCFPSLEEIEAIDDLLTVIEILENYQVPYEGLEDLEELKDRLRLEFARLNGEPIKEQVNIDFCL